MKTRKGLTFEYVVKLHIKYGWGFAEDQLNAFDNNNWSCVINQYLGKTYVDFLKEHIIERDYSDWIDKLCVFWDGEIDLNNYPIDTNYLQKTKDKQFVDISGDFWDNCMLLKDFIKLYGDKK